MRSQRHVLAAALLTVAALAMLVPMVSAWAHAELVSSSPADGDVLSTPPEVVSLTFAEPLLDQGHAITARDVKGQFIDLPEPTVTGDTIAVAWPDEVAAGTYTTAYRVVSADGHPVTGEISFTIATSSVELSAGTDPAPSESADGDGATGAAPDPGQGTAALVWVVALGVLLLAGAIGGTWFTRRSRGRG